MWRLVAVMLVFGCAHEPAEPLKNPTPKKGPAERGTTPAQVAAVKRTDLSPLAASLAEVTSFALGGVGVTGATSEGEKLTLALAREPDAIAMFEKLSTDINAAARLYAYWALRTLDPARAQQAHAALAADTTRIETWNGCLISDQTVQALVTQIDQLPRRMPR